MKTFAVALALTLATAASLVVLIDRFREPSTARDRLAAIEERLNTLSHALTDGGSTPQTPATGSNGTKGSEPPATGDDLPRLPSAKTLADAIKLLEEIEGMILDSERGLRRDLTGIYEKLLARIEEVSLKGSVPADSAEAKRQLREKVAQMGVTVDEQEGQLEIHGEVCEASRALEFLMVAPGGRAFESLLLVDLVPSALKIAMEDIGFVESDPDPQTWGWSPDAKGAYVYVVWEGLKKPRRIEDLIQNRATSDTMERTPWMFTASRFFTDNRTWERHFAADLFKNVAAITFNYTNECILACPLPAAADENIWFQHPSIAPKPGTKVKVYIRKEPKPLWDTP